MTSATSSFESTRFAWDSAPGQGAVETEASVKPATTAAPGETTLTEPAPGLLLAVGLLILISRLSFLGVRSRRARLAPQPIPVEAIPVQATETAPC